MGAGIRGRIAIEYAEIASFAPSSLCKNIADNNFHALSTRKVRKKPAIIGTLRILTAFFAKCVWF